MEEFACHAKIGPAGPILAEKFAKSGPARPICCQNRSPFANFGPHCKM